jgi:hypothetical protein
MGTCAIPPQDKRALAQKVGKHLTTLYGKRRTYSPQLVKAAMRRCHLPEVWDCWALSLFTSPEDFSAYHASLGEACDYASMQADMLGVLDTGSLFDFLSTDFFNFDLPSLDIGDVDISHHL